MSLSNLDLSLMQLTENHVFVDSHAHLNSDQIDSNRIIKDMRADHLGAIITVGYDAVSSQKNCEIAGKNANIYAAAGIHPNDTLSATDRDLQLIEHLCAQKKVVALGEIGLDYHYENTDKKLQFDYFIKQLKIAKKLDKPVIIHLRDAYQDMRQIISENLDCCQNGVVMHCFCGSKEEAQFYIDKGFYISFSGVVAFKNAKFDDIIRAVPLNRLMIETDCPYLCPIRGAVNEPKYVKLVAQKISEVMGKSLLEIANITTENALRFYKII